MTRTPLSSVDQPAPTIPAAQLLDSLESLGRMATALRRQWTDLTAGQREQRFDQLLSDARRLETTTRQAGGPAPSDATLSGLRPAAVPGGRAVGLLPYDARRVYCTVLDLVGRGGGLSEVLGYLIREVRPNRRPVDEALGRLRSQRNEVPGADRAVQLLEGALRSGLFH